MHYHLWVDKVEECLERKEEQRIDQPSERKNIAFVSISSISAGLEK